MSLYKKKVFHHRLHTCLGGSLFFRRRRLECFDLLTAFATDPSVPLSQPESGEEVELGAYSRRHSITRQTLGDRKGRTSSNAEGSPDEREGEEVEEV